MIASTLASVQALIRSKIGDDVHAALFGASFRALLVRVVAAGVALVLQVWLARMVGAEEYGIFSFAWVFLLALGFIATLGYGYSVLRFIPEAFETGRYDLVRGIITRGNQASFIGGLLIAVIAIGALEIWPNLVDARALRPMQLTFAIMPVYALLEVQTTMAEARSWTLIALVPTYILRQILILVFVMVALNFGAAANATTIVVAGMIATCLALGVHYYFMMRNYNQILPAGPKRYEDRKWLKVSAPLLLSDIATQGLTYTDIIVLGFFITTGAVTSSDVGIYFAVTRLVGLLSFFERAVTSGAGQKFSAILATGNKAELAAFYGKTRSWVFVPTAIVGLILFVFGEWLLSLFGQEFVSGVEFLPILLLGPIAMAFVGPSEALMSLTGRERESFVVSAIALSVNISLNLVLIPIYGVMGAAIATAFALVLRSVLGWWVVKTKY